MARGRAIQLTVHGVPPTTRPSSAVAGARDEAGPIPSWRRPCRLRPDRVPAALGSAGRAPGGWRTAARPAGLYQLRCQATHRVQMHCQRSLTFSSREPPLTGAQAAALVLVLTRSAESSGGSRANRPRRSRGWRSPKPTAAVRQHAFTVEPSGLPHSHIKGCGAGRVVLTVAGMMCGRALRGDGGHVLLRRACRPTAAGPAVAATVAPATNAAACVPAGATGDRTSCPGHPVRG